VKPEHVGAVMLAAGRSERMKEVKAFLPYDEKIGFIEKIILTYSNWGCNEIVVVTNTEAFQKMGQIVTTSYQVRIVVNDHPEYERFYSVKLGLKAILKSSFCFIQNVDNPFIDSQILDLIYKHKSDEKYISPVFENKGGHPVLLNYTAINQIRNWPDNSANLKDVLNTMECSNVEMSDNQVLININSPEEYKRVFT